MSGSLLYRAALPIFMAAALLLSGPIRGAADAARKPVRIAYQEFNRLMVVDDDNRPVSGYAYDYIQTIGTYAGWDVEFIPCDSFSDCVNRLLSGDVDLCYEISYTEERAKDILFPSEPMGHEYYYLYSTDGNTSITPDDPATFDGRTVGVTSGTTLVDLLDEWRKKKNVDIRIVEYEDIAKKEADLFDGRIDLDLEVSMVAKRNLSAVEKIGAAAYYLAANKARPDLIDDINATMGKIINNDFYYFSRLQESYFSDTVLSRNLTTDEKAWLAAHDTLRIGFFDDYLPFSALDKEGRPIGSAIEAIREIVRQLRLDDRLKLEFVCFDDMEKGYRAVESGEIDVMLPAYISNSIKQDYHVIGGKILASLVSELAFLNEYGEGKDWRIGVNRHNLMQHYYSKDYFPDSEIVFYDDIRGCLDGLLEGTADGVFLNGIRADALLKPGKYHSLRSVRVQNDFQLHMAFAEDNIGLLLLMDRGLTLLAPDFVNKASYSYMGRLYTFSAMDFLHEHMMAVVATVAILVALLVTLAGYLVSNRKLSGINRSLVEYSETIEKQREQESELRKQLEKKQEELEAALKKAQAASRAKTAFLNNMSHDIRTPMNAIIGCTGLAASHIDDKELIKDDLAVITQSSEHLLALINDVLDMGRIESGRMTLHEKPESLAEILRVLRDIVHADVRAKRHTFVVDTGGVKDDWVQCDKIRLNQVLLNLVSNAIKYTMPGGKISLGVSQKPSDKAGYGTYEFRCRDNGIGMGEKFLKTIFDPFAREETATVSGIQGTGLGMTIVRNIVEKMGGRIAVASKKGEGTEFTVSVDFRIADMNTAASAAEQGKARRADAAAYDWKGKKVLLVDDNELNVKVGKLQLLHHGVTVDTARNGLEAVDKIREKGIDAYDFILMDVQMPVMDGYEATSVIRKLPGGDKAKIIAYSANAFEEDREKSLQAGMDGHIAKPLKIDELFNELERFAS